MIVGAGMSGLCLAIRLKQSGIHDFTIIEKSNDVGGAWLQNSYPNAGCDVPSHLYSYSFAPSSEWSCRYARQPEILEYFRNCADRFDVRSHIVFQTEVMEAAWNEETQQWTITLDDGQQLTCDLFVSAVGQLSRPSVPKIAGADDFEGSVWHSASWNHDVDLAGQNVAIIGTGASTIQFLPTVVSQAERVYLFQRSPCWIHPFQNRRYSSLTKWCFRNLPFVARLYRLWLFLLCESRIVGFRKEGLVNHIYRWWLTRHMRSAIAPELHERLIPEYDPGCKRILLANDYLQTVQKPNVTLMTDSIQKLHVHEIETANDRYRVDVVIYGTGFQTTTLLQPMKITGRGGVELTEAWKDRPKTLFGLATPSFPNMFMLYGPNTNLGHNSIIYMVEAQVDYVMKCLAEADRRHSHEIEVAEDAVAEFDLQIHGDLQQSIWAGDCSSWYKTNDGTIPNNWSGAASTYRRRTRHPNFNAWKFSPIVETTTAWKLSEDSDS